MRVVIYKDEGLWIAQALEHDICAQAEDLKTVRTRLQLTAHAERQHAEANGKKPFDGIDPAPKHFHDMWDQASAFNDATSKDDDGIEMALCA